MAAAGDECAAASTAAPPITTLVGSSAGSSGFGISTDDGMEGEDDGEPCPKVSSSATVNKMDGALMAQRNTSPYAKPQGKANPPTSGEDAITQNKRVYVGNLSWSTTQSELQDHMSTAGEVIRADIILGYDGRSKGCAVVEYGTVEEANNAVASLNDTELGGRPIFVREDREAEGGGGAKSGGGAGGDTSGGVAKGGGGGGRRGGGGGSRTVYVGNLAYEVSWQDLKDHMRTAGDVVHAEIMAMHDGRSKGCGIVEFATPEGASAAIEQLNDSELRGRLIFVREDRERGGGGGGGFASGGAHHGGARGNNNYGNLSVFVGNLAYETSWQDLKDHMRAAGNIDKADILKSEDGRSKGCGIVLYQKAHEAARAIRELQNSELNGRRILVREDREQGGSGGGHQFHGQQHRGGFQGNHNRGGFHGGYQQQHQQHHPGFMPGTPAEEGCQVYVGNLSWETGWRELKDYFRQCGEVERSEVAEGSDGRKKGFGLVRFRTAADAQNAIGTLNGAEFMGRVLEVRLDNKA
ncbi:hypothetical protein ACHAXH_000293 [Discostella pseudostelligera]